MLSLRESRLGTDTVAAFTESLPFLSTCNVQGIIADAEAVSCIVESNARVRCANVFHVMCNRLSKMLQKSEKEFQMQYKIYTRNFLI